MAISEIFKSLNINIIKTTNPVTSTFYDIF